MRRPRPRSAQGQFGPARPAPQLGLERAPGQAERRKLPSVMSRLGGRQLAGPETGWEEPWELRGHPRWTEIGDRTHARLQCECSRWGPENYGR